MTKLYLDIDGVLVTARHTQAAPGVVAFVEFVTQHFACYWLTTHCKSDSVFTVLAVRASNVGLTTHCKGDSAPALRYLSQFLAPATLELLRQAGQPTTWETLKTEAIDVAADFYWLDDSPFQSEIAYLRARGVADRLVVVDLNQPNELTNIAEGLSLEI